MKTIRLAVLALLFCLPARAADQIVYATITVTNVLNGIQTNGTATLTVIGDTRTATNIVTSSPATLWLGTNAYLNAKSNLFQHIRLNKFGSGPTLLTLIDVSTNSFRLQGQVNQALSASIGGVWGTVVLSTNSSTNFFIVHTPYTYFGPTSATNVASGLVEFFQFATNTVGNGLTAFTNLIDRISHQVASNKTLYATTNVLGLADRVRITNAPAVSGSNAVFFGFAASGATNVQGTNFNVTNLVGRAVSLTGVAITNGFASAITNINPVTSNLVNYGSAIRSEGSGGNSLQIGSNAVASGSFSIAIGNSAYAPSNQASAFGNSAVASNGNALAVGFSAVAFGGSSLAIGPGSFAYNLQGIAIGQSSVATNESALAIGVGSLAFAQGVAIGFATANTNAVGVGYNVTATGSASVGIGTGSTATHDYSSAIGTYDSDFNNVTTTASNQLMLGTSLQRVRIPGQLQVSGTQTNTTFTGTNLWRGDISFPRAAVTTVANGHNTIDVGTNVQIVLSGSPTAAWAWGGITGGNRDGKFLLIENATGYPCDIIHNSGTEPTAANRINTGPTTTNVALLSSGRSIWSYDASASRWKLWGVFNGTNSTSGKLYQQAGTSTEYFSPVSTVFVQTNVVALTNKTFKSLCDGVGQTNFPANFFEVGRSVVLEMEGEHRITNPGVIWTNQVRLGGTMIASNICFSGTITVASNATAKVRVRLTPIATGASGRIRVSGFFSIYSDEPPYGTGSGDRVLAEHPWKSTSAIITVDTTAALAFSVVSAANITTVDTDYLRIDGGTIKIE